MPTPQSTAFPLWQSAASFAAERHKAQVRKDGVTPYFAHPVRVCLTLRTVFGCDDEQALAAALLHDTIEDTATDFDDIDERFGRAVADIVAALTKNMILPEPERERDYDSRLALADWRARLIKCADVYDNLSESLATRPESVASATKKAGRAIALAATDALSHEESRRAIQALKALMDGV